VSLCPNVGGVLSGNCKGGLDKGEAIKGNQRKAHGVEFGNRRKVVSSVIESRKKTPKSTPLNKDVKSDRSG